MEDVSKKYNIQFREAVAGDLEFIFNSWLTSYWFNSWLTGFHESFDALTNGWLNKVMSKFLYDKTHHKVIELIIRNPESVILVAVDQDDPNQILGWICAEPQLDNDQVYPVIHYCYVKHIAKNMGVMDYLLSSLPFYDPKKPLFFTHHTKAGGKIARKRKYIFNPYLLYKYNPYSKEQ